MGNYGLPPPWNAKYALPQNVQDEGLERHAYTTAWTRRGTFDNPGVGTAGYAVPGYITDQPYGGNAMSTRWAPRGSYVGPVVPHWMNRHPTPPIVNLGDFTMPGGALGWLAAGAAAYFLLRKKKP